MNGFLSSIFPKVTKTVREFGRVFLSDICDIFANTSGVSYAA